MYGSEYFLQIIFPGLFPSEIDDGKTDKSIVECNKSDNRFQYLLPKIIIH